MKLSKFFAHSEPAPETPAPAVAPPPPPTPAPAGETSNPMNVLITLEVDVAKFFKGTGSDLEKFGHAFAQIFGKAPSALQTVENFVNEAAPVIVAAVTLADPLLEPEVAGALAIVQTGLAAIQAAAMNANSGGSLLANLQNFATSVPSVLSGIQVKNPVLTAAVERIVNLVVGEAKVLIPAVQSWVAQIAAKNAPAATAAPAQS